MITFKKTPKVELTVLGACGFVVVLLVVVNLIWR